MANLAQAPAPAAAEAPSPQTSPPAEAQHLTVATPTVLAHASNPSKWRVPLLATLGAVFGFFIGTGLYGELQHPGDLLFIAVVTGTATYWFFDPLMELIYGWMGVPPRKIPENRRLYTTLAIVVAILLIAGLHHSLSKALEDQTEGISGFVYMLVVGFLTVGLTTLHWIKGAGTLPPRVAAHGARSGGLAGAAFGLVGLLGLAAQHKISVPADSTQAGYYAALGLFGIGIPSIMWLIPGLVGGLAIEKNWDKQSPTRGVLAAMAGLSLLMAIAAFLVSRSFPQYGNTAWLLALQFIPLNIGWGLGPFLQRESCDPAFRGYAPGMPALDEIPHGQLLPAGTVIPIDSLRGTTVPSQTGLSQTDSGPEYKQIPPHVLLLQPTGSRGWSLVILVLALAIGGFAYASGMARTDPEIVSEIEGKFQMDSGLHGKTITVQSADRVVTLAGNVDNGIQHTAAVQQASSVRGVKQLIDQVQVLPLPPPPAPKVVAAKAQAAPPQNSTTINASLDFFKSSGKHVGLAVTNHHTSTPKTGTPKTTASKTSAPKTTTPQKSGGFFHFLKRNNNKKNTNGH